MLEIRTAVISAVLSLDEHLSQTNTSCVPEFCYQPVYCCLIRYFLVRTRIAKCFTISSRRCRCELMFENEHALCSSSCPLLHGFCSVIVSSGLVTRVTLTRVSRGEVGRECYMGGGPASDFFFCTVVRDCFGLCLEWYTLEKETALF
jgi:hypothetical protein